jgi:hypothetical protein
VSYTCPICSRTSYHPDDEKYSYCGNCHDFTGAYGYGNERHRSSSTPAGQERKMRMPTNDKDGKAQPEVSQMQGEGDCPSLQQLRRERMERGEEPPMHTVSGLGVSGVNAPIPPQLSLYPSRFRYYFGATGLGMAVGITWTIAMTSKFAQRSITPVHAYMFLYGLSIFFFGLQSHMLYRWNKALKKHRIELDEYWDKYFAPQPNPFK